MKRILFVTLLLPLALLGGCAKSYDYTAHISECRSDVFRAETEAYSVTFSVVSREYPYQDDGIACPMERVGEVYLTASQGGDFEVYLVGEEGWGGEMSFRTARGDYFFSQSLPTVPEQSITLRIVQDGKSCEIAATSVKTEETLSPEAALSHAVAAEEEAIARMTKDGAFCGEFRVRLLRRDATYYYVGIVGTDKKKISLLLDSETGEVLAKRGAP